MTLKVGSQGPLVTAWQREMVRRFKSYALAADGGALRADGYYGYDDAAVQREYERRTGQPQDGVVSEADLRALGLTEPPPPKPRHLAIVFRGTGGVIGQDYVSRVCQGAADLVEERNPQWPASMGGLPPGAPGTPSMNKAVQIAIAAGAAEIRSGRSFVLGGYSAGAIVAAKLRAMLEPGQPLVAYRENYVCGFALGNPARAFGHTYYLGAIPNGRGISDFNMPASTLGWDWCDLVHPDDMYANVPLGDAGDIMTAIYQAVTDTQLSDPLGTLRAILTAIPKVLAEAGVSIPLLAQVGDAGALTGNPAAMASVLLPVLTSTLAGLIGGAAGGQLTGPAAAVQAAIIALRFAAAGTAPHINYHTWEVWPGQTYLGLAIQHVRDWAGRTPVRA
ncbi:lysin B [Mycobacterium phage IdentityCrisis]|uniref:Lysin B n=1 Tax=Mycobacterium phage IdentityCrisis TaxID=2599866 RepID=A0A5J6TH36_9CAUD|nr:lysin B [Mycobacterium phage IdentityCrisis]QFG10046.1 lysin B [Mycobacterium phage IdentityCrisis]